MKDGDRQHCFNHHHYRFENIQQDANVKADVDVKGGLLLKQREQSHHTTPPLARSIIGIDHRQICCNHHHHHRHHHHHHHRHHHQVTLAIDDLGPGDEGEYACKAENPWGDTTCTLLVGGFSIAPLIKTFFTKLLLYKYCMLGPDIYITVACSCYTCAIQTMQLIVNDKMPKMFIASDQS